MKMSATNLPAIGHTVSFRSDFEVIGRMPIFPESAIRDEPPLRGSPVAWARMHAGPIIQAFMDALPPEWLADPLTRIRAMPVWLRKGWSAGSVGWHLDGISTRSDGEEDFIDGRNPNFRRIGCNMGTNAPTLVLVGDITIQDHPLGQPLGLLTMKRLDEIIASGEAKPVEVQEGDLWVLTNNSFHSISEAKRDGFRMFFDANRPGPGESTLPPVEDFYNEYYTDFQCRTRRDAALMSIYRNDPQ